MDPLLFTFAIAFLFYILIPGIGGFYVRSRWRNFRHRIIEASTYPRISYGIINSGPEGLIGKYRFFGTLEAIQENRIWVRNEKISLRADLSGCSVYLLPTNGYGERGENGNGNQGWQRDEEPQRVSWNKIFSLPEGTKMFISGPLYRENGRRIFRSEKGNPLTVVIYDGPEKTILRRSIWSGRQKNEYWNSFTPMSVTAGSFGLFIHAYTMFRDPILRFPAIVTLTVSLLPVVLFIPPGILLFFLYRRLWNRGRFLRAERDLLQLPLRFFPSDGEGPYQETVTPDGLPLAMVRIDKKANDNETVYRGNPTVRTSSLLKESVCSCIIGTPIRVDGRLQLQEPDDPMAEFLIVPDNPASLSDECARKAHLFEITAALVFTVGLLVNVTLVFMLFTLFLK